MVKKGYYGKECFGLEWVRIEVRQTNLFITTLVYLFQQSHVIYNKYRLYTLYIKYIIYILYIHKNIYDT